MVLLGQSLQTGTGLVTRNGIKSAEKARWERVQNSILEPIGVVPTNPAIGRKGNDMGRISISLWQDEGALGSGMMITEYEYIYQSLISITNKTTLAQSDKIQKGWLNHIVLR